ncbi:arsenite efflux ATP-binding protein ArsA [Melghiribacillus thermohalophilus]|uniref:Arsenite efflux ATP-binding protein ArsA n=1 Tax=Melghiribacillus thermohalophilus TaxID=1324956 RepID=A0A4R3N5B5_9BACI|nr:ArsA family ATPase [Melghiribacillus thermohalophilus]TCT23617.1 arsenite efflux ATP-binding protein ArsA [Melghiribacillus thermohalophilus]
MNDLLRKNVLFVGGKGGVGKSTSSAALAMASAHAKQKTLLVSTDPAHNIGDIFQTDVGGDMTKITENLFALEIDSETETKKYLQTVKDHLKGMVRSDMIDEVNRQIDTAGASPGASEAALFDRLVSIVLDEISDFDLIVFDTAPTGHTIRLLTLPELMGVWIDGMLERRRKTNEHYTQLLNDGDPVEDPVYEVLQARKEKFAKVRDILLDHKRTGYLFVLIPERLPIIETKNALKTMDQHHLHVDHLIVNKILPEKADGEFLAKRRELERSYLKQIREVFSDRTLIEVPLFEEDITDFEKLKTFSTYMTK